MEQLRAWVGHPDAPGASAARVLGWALVSFLGFAGARRFGAPLCFPRSQSLRPTDCNYFAISVVNIVHAVVMGAASVSMIVGDDVELWGDYNRRNLLWESFIEMSAGYFVYDALLTMLIPTDRGPTEKALNYLHHAISVLTHYYPVCVCKHGVPISVVGYVAELSTPFTNMRWLLKECWQGGTNSRAYLVNGVLMAVVFFGCRVIGMAVLLYMMFVTYPTVTGVSVGEGLGGGVGYLIAPATLVFYLLNLYWMYKILRGVIDKVCLKRD